MQLGRYVQQCTLGQSRQIRNILGRAHKSTGQCYDIKCIKCEGLATEADNRGLHSQADEPFLVEGKFYYLVTEYMEGSELVNRIGEKS